MTDDPEPEPLFECFDAERLAHIIRSNSDDVVEEGGQPVADAAVQKALRLYGLLHRVPVKVAGFARQDGGAYVIPHYDDGSSLTFAISPIGAMGACTLVEPLKEKP